MKRRKERNERIKERKKEKGNMEKGEKIRNTEDKIKWSEQNGNPKGEVRENREMLVVVK